MNAPIPSGPERHSGPDGGSPDSGVPAPRSDTAGDLAAGMDIPAPAEPPDAISDDEYEPL